LLSVPRHASQREIKLAYRRALLRFHPDKLSRNLAQHFPGDRNLETPSALPSSTSASNVASTDIALLKDAYITLSSPHLRARFDRQVEPEPGDRAAVNGPRPAQIISLEDFDEVENTENLGGMTDRNQSWCYRCRCGGVYIIGSSEMDEGQHLVACDSCSEVIWVGYELVEEDNDG
jgi:diphthamide biosynthesis protein 4